MSLSRAGFYVWEMCHKNLPIIVPQKIPLSTFRLLSPISTCSYYPGFGGFIRVYVCSRMVLLKIV